MFFYVAGTSRHIRKCQTQNNITYPATSFKCITRVYPKRQVHTDHTGFIQVIYRSYTGFTGFIQVLYRFHAVMTDRTDPCLQKCTPLRYACTSDSPEYIAGFYLMSAARTGNTLFLAAFCPYFRKEIGSIMLSGLKIIYTNV